MALPGTFGDPLKSAPDSVELPRLRRGTEISRTAEKLGRARGLACCVCELAEILSHHTEPPAADNPLLLLPQAVVLACGSDTLETQHAKIARICASLFRPFVMASERKF